jgi:hypothetical protein
MKKKKGQFLKEKKLFSNRRVTILSIVLVAIIVSSFLILRFFVQTSEVEFSFKAAIIDQIGETYPSSPASAKEFNETVTNLLQSAGFNVFYHKSKSITVNFYKELAKYNYGIIILRAHSALRQDETLVDFFTSEEFKENAYLDEQNSGWLTKGNFSWEPNKSYFAITSKFIENLDGYFPRSIIIAMGCNSLNQSCTEMAEAFLKKGAKAYIGWTSAVSMSYSDNSTMNFLRYFLAKNMTINEAINKCNKIPDPEGYYGKLACYPSAIGNYKLPDFTADVVLSALFVKNEKHPILKIAAQFLITFDHYTVKVFFEHASRIV